MRLPSAVVSRFRVLRSPAEPEPEPEADATRQQFVVVAYHSPAQGETYHGPFSSEADAQDWASAKLKTVARHGWEVERLYSPDEGGIDPIRQERAR